jgi:type IV pilus assembly protein PilC
MATTFAYKVRDQAGNLVEGQLEADDQALVVGKLRQMGYTPISVQARTKAKFSADVSIPGLGNRVKLKDLAVFSRQFATMINSGLTLIRALAILSEQTENPKLAQVIADVRLDVEKGSSLSVALAKHPKTFNRLYIAMVRSGEIGGVLDSVLMRLSDTLEKQVELRRRVRSAMTYPVVALVICSGLALAMLLLVVPQFKVIYDDLGGTLPLPTRVLISLSDMLIKFFPLFVIVVGIGVWLFRRWCKSPAGKPKWDAFRLRVPVFGALARKVALARFSRTLAALTRSGVGILESLDIVAETSGNEVVAVAIRDTQGAVKRGDTLARPLEQHEVFPPMVVQMISVGEETGAIDEMLDKIADFYDSEVAATVDALASLIEPMMMLAIGAIVGGMIISLYLPLFNIIKLIK